MEKKIHFQMLRLCVLHKNNRGKHPKMSLPDMIVAIEVMEEDSLEARGKKFIKVRDNILSHNTSIGIINKKERPSIQCYRCGKMGHSANLCRTPWEKICEKKEKPLERGNPPESSHYVIARCNVGMGLKKFLVLQILV